MYLLQVTDEYGTCDSHKFAAIIDEDLNIEEGESCKLSDLNVNTNDNFSNDINNVKMKMGRKANYCIICKKTVKEFCKHFETVHQDTLQGKELKLLNKIHDKALRKKLKTKITDMLRKKGNAEYSRERSLELFVDGNNAKIIPVKRSSKGESNQNNTVKCCHCEGYYRRRKFSQHLKNCSLYLEKHGYNQVIVQSSEPNTFNTNTTSKPNAGIFDAKNNTVDPIEISSNLNITSKPQRGTIKAIKDHSRPVVETVKGASKQLMEEVLAFMKPRAVKDVALRDPLIMSYASEFHKSRRDHFQRDYISRVITDLARLVMRMSEMESKVTCLEEAFNPFYFTLLVKAVLEEAGYDADEGKVAKCGLGNRLRSHIKKAAMTAKKEAIAQEYQLMDNSNAKARRKMFQHFLETLEENWANEAGRIFDQSVKESRSETEPKMACESDIVTVCQYVTSNYRRVIKDLEIATSNSIEKCSLYNTLLDLLITHIMCLIRRRPVDFKRGKNMHYEKLDKQEDLVSEIKNSKHMSLTEEDLQLCNRFKLFYVPGKGWKEMVPIALTSIMKEAMDAIQRNKKHVGITSCTLFERANGMAINPRECLRKVTKNLTLKKPLDLSGNGLRHHAGTFSKLHSSHPNYQDYLASALGHTLHIHKLHYEMPTNIVQKLIVVPVLHKMTLPVQEREDKTYTSKEIHEEEPGETCLEKVQEIAISSNQTVERTPEKTLTSQEKYDELSPVRSLLSSDSDIEEKVDRKCFKKSERCRLKWSDKEKEIIFQTFGKYILNKQLPPRRLVTELYNDYPDVFIRRTVNTIVSFLQSRCDRKVKAVTPEVKKFMVNTHRKLTNVPI